jgi:hypothetical protein
MNSVSYIEHLITQNLSTMAPIKDFKDGTSRAEEPLPPLEIL